MADQIHYTLIVDEPHRLSTREAVADHPGVSSESIKSMLRQHGITIEDAALILGVTKKHVRQVRNNGTTHGLMAWEWMKALPERHATAVRMRSDAHWRTEMPAMHDAQSVTSRSRRVEAIIDGRPHFFVATVTKEADRCVACLWQEGETVMDTDPHRDYARHRCRGRLFTHLWVKRYLDNEYGVTMILTERNRLAGGCHPRLSRSEGCHPDHPDHQVFLDRATSLHREIEQHHGAFNVCR